jgi:hypothetical protein
MQQTAALLASARVAVLFAGVLVLSQSVVTGSALIAAACLSWGISVALGVGLCRSGGVGRRPYAAGVEQVVAPAGGRTGPAIAPPVFGRGCARPSTRARPDRVGSRSG